MRVRLCAICLLPLCVLSLFGAPPLRLAVSAGPDGLSTAGIWADFADAYRAKTGEDLEPIIAADDGEALQAMEVRAAEAAVLDTVAFLENRQKFRLIGVAAEFGSDLERFLLLAGADSIIYGPNDLWRARIVLAGPPGSMAWDYPLAWARPYLPRDTERNGFLQEAGYEGVLKSIALGQAEAGFLAEGFFAASGGTALLDRVRVIASTPAYPLAVLVIRRDLSPERTDLARSLLGLSSGSLVLREPCPDISEALGRLAEALRVDGQ